ncbi:MAG: nucleotide pyrophosphohydrolase [Conexivisphaerales archaeon]
MTEEDSKFTIGNLKTLVKEFISQRKWERYHNPKDLAESISVESAELLEIFQWKSQEQSWSLAMSEKGRTRVKEELADVLIYCISLANVLGLDINTIVREKIKKNSDKYPTNGSENLFG